MSALAGSDHGRSDSAVLSSSRGPRRVVRDSPPTRGTRSYVRSSAETLVTVAVRTKEGADRGEPCVGLIDVSHVAGVVENCRAG